MAIDSFSATASVVEHNDGTVTDLNRYEKKDTATLSALKEDI